MKKSLKVLLVEDDADDAELALYTLNKIQGLEVKHIDDGAATVDYLFSLTVNFPDLILLDLRMPKVDGIEVLRKIKSHPSLHKIPVIAFISSVEGRGYLESFQLKADGYILKPLTVEAFFQVICQVGLGCYVAKPETVSKSSSV